ncbi:MAG TPA: methionine--tRNA ligase [Candidatus Brocadiia bacterium]|nr:methionine--tRNA ligase [Candidatus Brocadiia bacterium]
MPAKFYLTTPIYYVNDVPHLGHAYTTIAADVLARYRRLKGNDVRFLTGVDEHGQKVEKIANAKGMTPQAYTDEIVQRWTHAWTVLEISNDDFIRTTEKRHETQVQAIFQRLLDNGDVYDGEYSGWYCIPCETFWLETQLENKCCPDCKRPVETVKERNYFFRLSRFSDMLTALLGGGKFLQPERSMNEMLRVIESGLADQSISRQTVAWGIQTPPDPNQTIYVWFDALCNYVTALGMCALDKSLFERYWPADVHLVGKEITRFHTLLWPAMLNSLGVEIPGRVFAHGWMTINGQKMSKSLGNAIDPLHLAATYGADPLRFYMMREATFGQDWDFSHKSLVSRLNNELGNDFGNLLLRTSTMLDKYRGGVLPEPPPADSSALFRDAARKALDDIETQMDQFQFSRALEAIWGLITLANRHIDDTKPWTIAKDKSRASELDAVLYNLAETNRLATLLLSPFIPTAAKSALGRFGLEEVHPAKTALEWGAMPGGTRIEKGVPLFPRVEEKE